MNKTTALILMTLACCVSAGWAQLRPGDAAVVAFNSHGVDDFAWVALRDIPSDTVINFTDSSVSNGCFRWSEHLATGPLRWSHSAVLRAGSVVRWVVGVTTNWSVGQASGDQPDFSAEGDQLIVYTGTISNNAALMAPWRGDPGAARMIYGANFANAGWDNVLGGSPSCSFVPPGLSTEGCTAVHIGSLENGYYSGPRTGTAVRLLKAIADTGNWTTHNDPFSPTNWAATFEVIPVPGESLLSVH